MKKEAKLSTGKAKKSFRMPGAFTILFILTIIAVLATYIVPSGSYAKLQYDPESSKLLLTDPSGKVSKKEASQKSWTKLVSKSRLKSLPQERLVNLSLFQTPISDSSKIQLKLVMSQIVWSTEPLKLLISWSLSWF